MYGLIRLVIELHSSFSFALACVPIMSEKYESTSPSAVWVKSQRKTVGIKEQLYVID
jgi:hypothetical protein